MRTYILRRLLLFVPTIFGVTLVVFIVLRIVPGDPALVMLGGFEGEGTFTQQDLDNLRENLGLNDPIAIQYLNWIADAASLDFGDSFFTNTPIWDEVRPRLPLTLQFAFMAIFLAVIFALPMGVISAVRQDTWADYSLRVFAIIGLAMPTFWVGSLVLLGLSLQFNWIPPLGYTPPWESPWTNFVQLIFPAVALAYSTNAVTARITRSQMLEVLREDYIRTAMAKGLQGACGHLPTRPQERLPAGDNAVRRAVRHASRRFGGHRVGVQPARYRATAHLLHQRQGLPHDTVPGDVYRVHIPYDEPARGPALRLAGPDEYATTKSPSLIDWKYQKPLPH